MQLNALPEQVGLSLVLHIFEKYFTKTNFELRFLEYLFSRNILKFCFFKILKNCGKKLRNRP